MRNGRMWEALKRRARGSRPKRGERGAVLVEALIVIPVLMMITLGIVEYGGAYREDSTVAAASRAGARVASALSKEDFGASTASADAGVATETAVASVLQSLGSNAPQYVWIYRVEPGNGSCGPPTFGGCAYKVGYQWIPGSKSFNPQPISGSTAWLGSEQDACAGAPPDEVGVWITMNHTAITHMFGTGRALTGQTVMRLEPSVDSNCDS